MSAYSTLPLRPKVATSFKWRSLHQVAKKFKPLSFKNRYFGSIDHRLAAASINPIKASIGCFLSHGSCSFRESTMPCMVFSVSSPSINVPWKDCTSRRVSTVPPVARFWKVSLLERISPQPRTSAFFKRPRILNRLPGLPYGQGSSNHIPRSSVRTALPG